MKRYRKIVSVAVLLAICALVVFPAITLAIIDPDGLQVNAVYVYDDLLAIGDVGILIDYFIDYTISGNPPTGETANEAYLGIFIDTDGTTQLKAIAPYAYDDLGYGRGLIWIYFTAAEAGTHGIDRANIALYKIWLTGNPTLGWVPGPDPPKVIADIDYWQPVGTNTSTLFALRIMSLAQSLGTAWTEVLYEETPLGARLTAKGEDYFTNTIPNLRDMAPNVFSAGTSAPVQEDLDYSTAFGAIMTNGTGTVVDALGNPPPITLSAAYNSGTAVFTNLSAAVVGTNTVWTVAMAGMSIKYTADDIWHTVLSVEDSTHLTLTVPYTGAGGLTGAYVMTRNLMTATLGGTLIVTLAKGTVGTVEDIAGGATVTGGSVALVQGVNTVTVALLGTNRFMATVYLVNTQTAITDTVTGTPFDLSALAIRFGVSTMMLSGMVWLVISIIICAGVYKISDTSGGYSGTGGKTVLLVFDICLIGGAVLGLLPVLVAVLMFIGFSVLTGYVLFFRAASF